MSIFAKLFKKKTTEEESARVGGMEDFMTLIRVYYQAVMAAQLGISNINALPDMAVENPDPKQQVRRGRAFAMQKDADRHLWHQRILL